MAVGDRQPTELDEFLSRAVDRQVAEQRALREALNALRDAVSELRLPPAPPPGITGETPAPNVPAVPALPTSVLEVTRSWLKPRRCAAR